MKHTAAKLQKPQRGLSEETDLPSDFAAFIRSEKFPCVGAKSAMALGLLSVFEGGDFLSLRRDRDLYDVLVDFSSGSPDGMNGLASFACLFDPCPVLNEKEFEAALWRRLQGLHDIDAAEGVEWAQGVGREPSEPDFSFSVGGVAYFVVGLHPGASRTARRFCRPALVFNAHEQFKQLRRDGRYEKMQSIIRDREIAHEGSINPMLTDFGRGLEAAQYGGRRVPAAWSCPFTVRT
jgi:FPC/CPF motif-containing protein YcgG